MTVYGTSELGYRVRHEASAVFNADDRPVGNYAARSILTNGLNFYADIHAQQRMCFAARAIGPTKDAFFGTNSLEWTQVAASGAFPIAIRENGESYRIRLDVGGCTENAGTKVNFAVVLAPIIDAPSVLETVATVDTDSVWTSGDVSSATPAYVSGTSRGPAASARLIGLTALEVSQYTVATGTPVDIGGASGAVPQCLVNLVVFAKTEDVLYQARLYNVCAQEWSGS